MCFICIFIEKNIFNKIWPPQTPDSAHFLSFSAQIEYRPALPLVRQRLAQSMPVGHMTKFIVTYPTVSDIHHLSDFYIISPETSIIICLSGCLIHIISSLKSYFKSYFKLLFSLSTMFSHVLLWLLHKHTIVYHVQCAAKLKDYLN